MHPRAPPPLTHRWPCSAKRVPISSATSMYARGVSGDADANTVMRMAVSTGCTALLKPRGDARSPAQNADQTPTTRNPPHLLLCRGMMPKGRAGH
eukprot:scaffold15949_cov140-Isochrysis_galbana.AAC.1